MDSVTREIAREYRVDFQAGEPHWEDPVPPEVTAEVLGRRTTCVINRTSLLAWSLTKLPEVIVADLTSDGWIKVVVSTGPDFDEPAFSRSVGAALAAVAQV